MSEAAANATDKIVCQIDGALVHHVGKHIKDNHANEWTLERYKAEFPDEPLISETMKKQLKRRREQQQNSAAPEAATPADGMKTHFLTARETERLEFADVFDLGNAPAALNARGEPIPCSVLTARDKFDSELVPDIDPNYVFDINLLKTVLMGFEMRMNVYLWGFHGTGKTTQLEQFCARTKRQFLRVQHTVNTEEAHIVGQYVVHEGSTVFQLGPLAEAMQKGYTYCADEYDFAMPSVLSVYQPVLEGKPLVIKDAPPELRIIRPHPDFRFCATGNTNGGGDETGLYQGTSIQNAANYSRFHIVNEVRYMEKQLETSVIAAQARIGKDDARSLVNFAADIREAFENSQISSTISPRELITAARLAVAKGSDWKAGISLAFANRLSRIDKSVVDGFMQRIWG